MMNINKHIYTLMALLLVGAVTAVHAQEIKIGGNVYGGCKAATVTENTNVTITEGVFGKNIFGGGEGSIDNTDPENPVVTYADVNGNTTVTISGGKFDIQQITSGVDAGKLAEDYNIYGGGNVACRVGKLNEGVLVDNTGNTTIQMTKGMAPQSFFMSDQYYKWSMYVNTKQNKPVQCGVFGAGYGKNTEVLGNTDVNIRIGEPINTLATEEEIMQAYNLAFAADGSTPQGSEKLAAAYVANVMGGGYDGIVGNTPT